MKQPLLFLTAIALFSYSAIQCSTMSDPVQGKDTNDYEIEDSSEVEEDDFVDESVIEGAAISAEKESWTVETKGSEDRAFAKDIPWKVGDKVLLLSSDQTLENCTEYVHGNPRPSNLRTCTVAKTAGLKCELVSESPLEEGTYQAVYPVYNYVWYNFLHLSFLYEQWKELDYWHQDIVVSEPVSYKEGHKLKIVMKHVCALVDIDIYPPKTGDYSYLKVFAQSPVFAGKAGIYFDKEYDVNEIASGWLNFTTLRGDGRSLKKGEVFQTSTGVLPIQYEGMPMTVHLVYTDGTHYVSEPFAMPSLNFGVENKLEVKDFQITDEPMQGLWGNYYQDPDPSPYPVN